MSRDEVLGSLGVLLAGAGLLGCVLLGIHLASPNYSEVMTEEAVVEQVPFAPAQNGTSVSTGLTSSNSVTTTVGSVTLDASYAVVFRCQHHGRFAVQGGDERHQKLWSSFKVGQRVRISYRQKLGGGGKVLGYDFLDVQALP